MQIQVLIKSYIFKTYVNADPGTSIRVAAETA
jgi:hypothetical protein